jgi:23S rRNA (uracil1939-C5)-methyltransferase
VSGNRRRTAPATPAVAVVESLDHDGRGVAHADGKVVFIEGALTGERVEYLSFRRKPSYEIANLVRVIAPSGDRVQPRCPHFGTCGGCAMQHLQPPSQIAVKQRVLEDAFERIGKVSPETLLAPIAGPTWGYRHRARFSVRLVPKKGGVLVGFHERKSSYVADMSRCEVVPPAVSRLIVPLRDLVGRLSFPDRMPQVEVAVGARVTVLVFRILQPLTDADAALLRAFADEHGVQLWMQEKGPDTARPFWPLDAPPLDYELPEFDLRMAFLPTDFTQVNHGVNRMLVRRAMRLLDPRPGERIADLFCGLGNFTLPMARLGAEVTGYEGSAALVARARANAAANGVERTSFAVANLFEPDGIPDLAPFDKLLVDPPRDGAVELVKALPDAGGPGRIVYVSCDPATLARDAAVLVQVKGYRLRSAGIANMFPHTGHVESIALFER